VCGSGGGKGVGVPKEQPEQERVAPTITIHPIHCMCACTDMASSNDAEEDSGGQGEGKGMDGDHEWRAMGHTLDNDFEDGEWVDGEFLYSKSVVVVVVGCTYTCFLWCKGDTCLLLTVSNTVKPISVHGWWL